MNSRTGEAPGNTLTLTLPSPLEIVLTRDFAAPRALVISAHTQPAHLVHW